MISDSTSPLSKLVFYTKGFVLIVISLTINNITLNQGVLTTRVPLNGLSNGPYVPEAPVNFLISPSLLSSHQTLSPPQLSTIETSQFFQKANPSYDNLGESIAKTILHSFHLIDDDSEIRPKRNNNVRRKKTKLRDNQSPNEAITVYRGGEDQGTSFILKESIKSENESPSIDGSSGYILQDDSENENAALTDDEEIISILEQNAKKKKKKKQKQKKVDNDEDDDSADEGDDAPVKAKPGRYVIKKIFKGKNGELTAVDWIEDRGHAKQDAYHKEEWEDTQQKRNVVRKKIRKSPNKGGKKDETKEDEDTDEDQSSNKKSKKEKKKRKKKKSNKQKKKLEDDDKKEAEETSIDGEHIPQLLWSYLSRKNGKDDLPIEQIKISKV